jgi:hypothetical protein
LKKNILGKHLNGLWGKYQRLKEGELIAIILREQAENIL